MKFPGLDRRGFLRSVATAVAAGVVFDVDKALWVPGAKKIFLPETILFPDCRCCKENLIAHGARELFRVMSRGTGFEHLYTQREVDSSTPYLRVVRVGAVRN